MSDIRASDDERERAVETLRRHAAAGRLDAAELDERLGLALGAKTRGELAQLTADLPAEQAPRRPAQRRSHAGMCGSHGHDPRRLAVWAVVLVAIWAMTGAGYFWPMWPLLGFALAGWSQWRRSNARVIGNPARTGNSGFTQ